MQVSISVRLLTAVMAAMTCGAPAWAQQTLTMNGRVVNSVTGDPVATVVVIEELNRETMSAEDGSFRFEGVAPGTYHLWVRSEVFSPRRTEIVLTPDAAPFDLRVDPGFHEVVSVSPEARSAFEAYQATSVLVGQELDKRLEMSLGATLENQPGLTARTNGPATARPVVRGLDGDRVLILQDGQRTGDLSSQSSDHAVTINPAASRRIEVVRGPATLLYGSNAVGGLVNVITEDIPTRALNGVSGSLLADAGSAADEFGTAASVRAGSGSWAFAAGGGGRRSSDVRTPEGELVNSQSRNGFGSAGASWIGSRGYLGGSYGYDDTKMGVPIVEDGTLETTPRRHSVSLRGEAQRLEGLFASVRGTLAFRRYKHEELEDGAIGTAFKNNTNEIELLGAHRAIGRLSGSVGGAFLDRAFDAAGEEALSPPVDQGTFAAFAYEELTWPHVTIQFGGRIDRAEYTPAGETVRDFTTGSGSAGVLFRPAAAEDALILAVSLARAARYPALEELFYYGPHPGNFAFEVGNPALEPEYAFGLDVSLRWQTGRVSGEVTYFRNDIANYVFRSPLDEADFDARQDEFAERFPSRGIDEGEGPENEDEFPIVEYVGADSLLQGIEAHADFQVTQMLDVEVGLDYVRGTLESSGEPLPRIPPFRFRGGLRYRYNALQLGGEAVVVAAQERVYEGETSTDGYELLRLYATYSFQTGGGVSTITLRGDNVTDTLYRNHLSYIKDLTAEMGRNFRVVYSIGF